MKTRVIMSFKFIIKKDHPALAGHFPDKPVVPGVVILDQVISQWCKVYKKKISGLPYTKFIQILKPDIECFIEFQSIKKSPGTDFEKTAFIITNNEDVIICKGIIEHE